MQIESSYVSANSFPLKLLADSQTITEIREKRIRPIQVQINPTNKCPANCSFCSCKNRNKGLEMELEMVEDTITRFKKLGAKCVTITGGGDPMAHPHINDILDFINDSGLEIGLVTNGILLKKMKPEILKKVTWCRISENDERPFMKSEIEPLIKEAKGVDFSFSYVVTKESNLGNLINVCRFAGDNDFSHVRIVEDILDIKADISELKLKVAKMDVVQSILIWQGRKKHTRGSRTCKIGLLKPNIDVSGNVLPCCGIQYAKMDFRERGENQYNLDFDKRFRMGTNEDIEKIWKNQTEFNGNICDVCYYSEYNNFIDLVQKAEDLKHKNFV